MPSRRWSKKINTILHESFLLHLITHINKKSNVFAINERKLFLKKRVGRVIKKCLHVDFNLVHFGAIPLLKDYIFCKCACCAFSLKFLYLSFARSYNLFIYPLLALLHTLTLTLSDIFKFFFQHFLFLFVLFWVTRLLLTVDSVRC